MKRILGPAFLLFMGMVAWYSPYWEVSTQSFWYGLSLVCRSILQCFTPFLVVCMVGGRLLQSVRSFWRVGVIMLPAIVISNFCLIWIPYLFYTFYPPQIPQFVLDTRALIGSLSSPFHPLFTCRDALLFCLFLAVVAYFCRTRYETLLIKAGQLLERIGQMALKVIVIFFLPPILFGAAVKLRVDDMLPFLIDTAGAPYMESIQITLILLMITWLAISRGSIYKVADHMQGLTPSLGVAFISMSSMITLPILGAYLRKVVKHPKLIDLTLPPLSNVHSFGSAIISGSTGLLILTTLGGAFPTPLQYLGFAISFVMAKFCMVALPGGITIIMLPLLERHFGFTAEMGSLLLIIDLMTDCIVTVMNVLGNGALAIIIDTLYDCIYIKRKGENG